MILISNYSKWAFAAFITAGISTGISAQSDTKDWNYDIEAGLGYVYHFEG